MANIPEDPNPYGNHYFALEISDGSGTYEVGHFLECTGLKSTADVFEIVEGGLNGRTHKRPGYSRWQNITLRYATNASTLLLEWRDRCLQDQFTDRTRYSGSIMLKNNHGDIVRRWHFTGAWPVGWEGPALKGMGSELAVEMLEIAHDGLTVSNR